MSPINVGVSEYPGRTHGKMQRMTKVQAGLNLRAALFELERDYGEIATVNEADRSRPDQLFMRAEFLAGRGALAAYCTAAPPPGQYTSTHDPVNHGDGADLGGPGGAVLSVRAHNLLDGNHPDGVLGRKYGLYNTGAFFYIPEWWHFNIYPARAAKLATLADSLPAPTADPITHALRSMSMHIVWNENHTEATIFADNGKFWKVEDILDEKGKKFMGGRDIVGVVQRVIVSDQTKQYPETFNNAQLAALRVVWTKLQ